MELIDCGSRFGTFVNGRRVRHARLADNDVIRLGHALLHLRHVPADVADGDVPTLMGRSPYMAAVRWQVAAASLSGSAVLIEGELGTGKEVTARALHERWVEQGRKELIVAFNCAELSQELAAGTLFGHVRGAFTGAQDSRPGLFRSAEGGTLFLDEIGELPLDVQPMLLRALEERRIAQVGREDRLIDCDVRIVAATNRDLTAAVAAGRFAPTYTAGSMRCASRCPRCANVARRSCRCCATCGGGRCRASTGTSRKRCCLIPGRITSAGCATWSITSRPASKSARKKKSR